MSWKALAAGLLCTLSCAPVLAQDSTALASIDWQPQCTSKGRHAPMQCSAQAVQVLPSTKLTATLVLSIQDNGADLNAVLPLGLNLPEGITYSVDRGPESPMSLRTCLPQGCVLVTHLTSAALTKLKSATVFSLSAHVGGQLVKFDFPMENFAGVFEQIR